MKAWWFFPVGLILIVTGLLFPEGEYTNPFYFLVWGVAICAFAVIFSIHIEVPSQIRRRRNR